MTDENQKFVVADILTMVKIVHDLSFSVKVDELKLEILAKRLPEFYWEFVSEINNPPQKSEFPLSVDLQMVFVLNAVNFSFWPDAGESTWSVETINKNGTKWEIKGYYALFEALRRAVKEDTKVLSPNFLAHITEGKMNNIFSGLREVRIPMFEERMMCLKNAGEVLLKKFSGKFSNVVEESGYDAEVLANLIAHNFDSFYDTGRYKSIRVPFFKRAQLCARDTDEILKQHGESGLRNTDKLTAFADYRLPQVLRRFGVFQYSERLKSAVVNKSNIQRDDPMEVEIRANTVWAVELMRKFHEDKEKYSSGLIYLLLWKASQHFHLDEPHHRTRTIFY